MSAVALLLLVTVLPALLSLAARPTIYRTPHVMFLIAVLVAAWLGSFRLSLVPIGVGIIFANYFLRSPVQSFSLAPQDLQRAAVWASIAGIFAFFVSRLKASESHALKVLGGINDGFMVLDRNWNLVYINKAGAQAAGKSSQEMIGRNYWELAPEIKGSVIEQQLRRCAAEGVPVQFETCAQPLRRWLQFRVSPFAEGISVFFQDITEAKEREEKLRSSLDHLAAVHKAARMGTFEWNVRTGQIIWSEDTYHIHGLRREDFDGQFETWLKSIHPEDLPSVLAHIQRALEEKNEYYAEYRVVWPNGEIRWFGGHGQVMLDEHGEAVFLVGICSDITHRHQEEEALRRSEKLAAAGRLAATIAHEINNPLEAVTNLVYLMRQDPGIKANTRELLRLADEQLARVNHIAKQTLGFYQDRNVPEAVDVVQTLEGLLSILQSRINVKQLRITREYENACLLRGFRGELRQVLSNLLTNAIDASPSGGTLILRVRPERNEEQIARVHIEVEDFGSGINPGDQSRIFEPFFTTKSDFGTGLGLWVTKELVEKHGGTIGFRSNCQHGVSGTCFYIVLPAPENALLAASLLDS